MPAPARRSEPTRVIPDMAFAPDISGVCKVDGTFEISSNPRKIAKTKMLVLEVRTKEDCWLRVSVDKQIVFEKTLAKGKTEKWQGKENISLRIGKPEALEVLLNGRPIDLKEKNVKRSLFITHQEIEGK